MIAQALYDAADALTRSADQIDDPVRRGAFRDAAIIVRLRAVADEDAPAAESSAAPGSVPGDGGEALRREVEDAVCPKCKVAPGEPCTTGGYLPVGDLDGDVRPEGPHRQRRAAAAAVRERREDAPDGFCTCDGPGSDVAGTCGLRAHRASAPVGGRSQDDQERPA